MVTREGVIVVVCLLCMWGIYSFMQSQQRASLIKPFQAEVVKRNRPRVIDFYATWCGPCQSYVPTVAAVEAIYGDRVDFERRNIDDSANQALVRGYGVHAIPCTILINRRGEVVNRLVGAVDQDTLDKAVGSIIY